MEMYAVLGGKLSHTLSPQINQYVFKALNVDAVYGVLEVERNNISKVVDAIKVLGYKGINVTIPYKEIIMPSLDVISPEASAIGAVNTVEIREGRSYGYNSDYFGFARMLDREQVSPNGKEAVLFGAGGAAKALIAYLHDAKAKSILVVSNIQEELEAIKERFEYVDTAFLTETGRFKGDICINATPVGMYPKLIGESIIPEEVIQRFEAAVDIVYNPLETKFLKLARKNGLITCTGLYMLIYQAVKSQEIFHQTSIDLSIGDIIFKDLSKLFL